LAAASSLSNIFASASSNADFLDFPSPPLTPEDTFAAVPPPPDVSFAFDSPPFAPVEKNVSPDIDRPPDPNDEEFEFDFEFGFEFDDASPDEARRSTRRSVARREPLHSRTGRVTFGRCVDDDDDDDGDEEEEGEEEIDDDDTRCIRSNMSDRCARFRESWFDE
jgi:hypothetical protein